MGGSDQQGGPLAAEPRGSEGSASGPTTDTFDSLPDGIDGPGRRRGKKNRSRVKPDDVPKLAEDSPQVLRVMRYEGQFFKTKLCAFWQKNRCTRGKACKYAHGDQEMATMPDLSKTSICRNMTTKGSCTIEGCPFAHSPEELRATDKFYKTTMCSFASTGRCWLGALCRHAHDESELREVQKSVGSGKVGDDDLDLNTGPFGRSSTQPVPRIAPKGVQEWGRQTSQPDPVTTLPGYTSKVGDDDDLDLHTGPFQRSSTQPVPRRAPKGVQELGRQTSQPDPVTTLPGYTSQAPSAVGNRLVIDARGGRPASARSNASSARDALGRPIRGARLWSEENSDDEDFLNSDLAQGLGPGWGRASTLPAQLQHAPRGPELPRRGSGEHPPQARHLARRGAPHHLQHPAASLSQASLSQLEDIDEDLEMPTEWTRATSTPATMGCGGFVDPRRPLTMMGQAVPMQQQVPMRQMMMVVPVPQGTVPQAVPVRNGAVPMMMVRMPQGPQGQGVPGVQECSPMAQQQQQQQQFCVAMQQDPYMIAPGVQAEGSGRGSGCGSGCGSSTYTPAESSGCGVMMRQYSTGFTTPGTQGTQDDFMMAGGPPSRQATASSFVSTPGNQQDPFSMSNPPSRQVSAAPSYGGYQQDPFSMSNPPSRQVSAAPSYGGAQQDPTFLVSNDPPSRQISDNFCAMDPEEAVKLLESAMPDRYEE